MPATASALGYEGFRAHDRLAFTLLVGVEIEKIASAMFVRFARTPFPSVISVYGLAERSTTALAESDVKFNMS